MNGEGQHRDLVRVHFNVRVTRSRLLADTRQLLHPTVGQGESVCVVGDTPSLGQGERSERCTMAKNPFNPELWSFVRDVVCPPTR